MKSLKLNFLRYITRFIMFINYIMTIDIIFQYKRNFLELHSIIYFLNPFFYFEVFNNVITPDYSSSSSHFNTQINTNLMEHSKYEKDQISLLFLKYFKVKVHEPGFFNDYFLFRIFFLVFIFFCFIINMIKYKKSIMNILRTISSFFIFLFFNLLFKFFL